MEAWEMPLSTGSPLGHAAQADAEWQCFCKQSCDRRKQETGDGSNSVIQNRSELHVADNSPSTHKINQSNPASTPGSLPRQALCLEIEGPALQPAHISKLAWVKIREATPVCTRWKSALMLYKPLDLLEGLTLPHAPVLLLKCSPG